MRTSNARCRFRHRDAHRRSLAPAQSAVRARIIELVGSSRTASESRPRLSLNVNWLFGVKDTKRDEVLDGTVSFTARAAASNRTMKISASIATTLSRRAKVLTDWHWPCGTRS
jgi:hypothetical protein